MSALAQLGFDYTALAPDVRTRVETATRRLHELERRTSESIIEMGQQLMQVKVDLGHGHFLPWLEREFGWSDRTARRLMDVAREFGDKSDTVSNLSAKVLYTLAAPSTPEDVRAEFTGLAETGQPVRHSDVRESIDRHKAREPQRAESIPVDDWDGGDDEPEEVPYVVVDRATGEILPPLTQTHSISFAPTPQLPSMPVPEPTQPAKSEGMDAFDAARAVRALRGINTADVHEAAEYLTELESDLDDLNDLLPTLTATVSRIVMVARTKAAKRGLSK